MTRVLLTGAAGFLGAHVLRHLLAETDWTFACPVTFKHVGTPGRLVWAMTGLPKAAYELNRVDIIRCDLASPIDPVTADAFGEPDIILNLASDTHPPRSVIAPVQFWGNNTGISINLLEYARTLPHLAAFVQVSTDSVYGPAGAKPHVEWDPIVPNNPYAASKAAQEALAIAYWRSFDMPVMIVATMTPIGETQAVEKFVPMTVAKILRGEIINIHCDANSRPGARTYIDAGDVAAALLFLLRGHPPTRFSEGTVGQPGWPDRWNVVGSVELDNLDTAETIARALSGSGHAEFRYKFDAVDRPEHGHRYAMSGEKLASAGWEAGGDIRAVLDRTARWFGEHPAWLRG